MNTTINVEGYYSRDNVWLVIMINKNNKICFDSCHSTKADAIEHVKAVCEQFKPEFIWVTKTPYVCMEE
jgi:hypothetical protein